MPDVLVDKWKQEGNIYLWRFLENQRNFPGWHISIDVQFCRNFKDLVEKMILSQHNSHKSIKVSPPAQKILAVPNNRSGDARWTSIDFLVIKHLKNVFDSNQLLLEEQQNNSIILIVSTYHLTQFEQQLSETINGKNDYSMIVGETRLWFW